MRDVLYLHLLYVSFQASLVIYINIIAIITIYIIILKANLLFEKLVCKTKTYYVLKKNFF